jgi:ADP-heptose:LPS heptosyltransferase
LAWLSGAKHRVGFNQSGADYLFTRRIDFSENLHEIKRYLKLADICGAESDDYHLEAVKEKSQKPQTNFSDSLTICIAPGGGKNPGTFMPIKRWPYYAELVKGLKSEMDCSIILVGDRFDMESGEKIERENPGAAINLIGKTDFSELADIIQQSSLFIGNDSGALYLAAALGIPTVGIYGPSDPDLVAPPGEGHISIKGSLYCSPCYRPDTVYGQSYFDCWTKTFDCMRKLSVEKVMQAVKEQLEKISLAQA